MPDAKGAQARVPAARAAEIAPGTCLIVDIAGRSIGIFNVHGTFVAALNVCPHELAPVCRGRITGTMAPSQPGEYRWERLGEILRCPWHGWEFDLLTGRALADPRRHLRLFSVTVEDGTVYVTL